MGQQGEPSHTADEAPRLDASETTARVEALMARARGPQVMSAEERQEALDEIITLHAALAPQDEKSAEMAEVAFLLLLRDDPEILDDPDYRQFVAAAWTRAASSACMGKRGRGHPCGGGALRVPLPGRPDRGPDHRARAGPRPPRLASVRGRSRARTDASSSIPPRPSPSASWTPN